MAYKLQDVYDGEVQEKFTVISTFAGGANFNGGSLLKEKVNIR